jgi:hypothetical protein
MPSTDVADDESLYYNYDDDAPDVYPSLAEIQLQVIQDLDKREACMMLSRKLESWIEFPERYGWHMIGGKIERARFSVYEALMRKNYEKEIRREQELREKYVDGRDLNRVWIPEPVLLAFDPKEAIARDTGKDDEGVSFKRLWRDPLARTLWLAIRPHYLTSQHFRRNILNQAYWIRKNPPLNPDEMHLYSESSMTSGVARPLKVAVWPYVVAVLIKQGRWPYLRPANLPKGPIQYLPKLSA